MRFPTTQAADYQATLERVVASCQQILEENWVHIEAILTENEQRLQSLSDSGETLIDDAVLSLKVGEILKKLLAQFQNSMYSPAVNTTATQFIQRIVSQNERDIQATIEKMMGRSARALRKSGGYRAAGLSVVGSLSAKGQEISRDLIASVIEENVGLIKSIPKDLHAQVERIVMEGVTKGEGTSSIAEKLRQVFPQKRAKCEFIARDQAGKFYGTMTRIRMGDAQMKTFVWVTMDDNRVRDSHRPLHGRVFTWAKGWNGIFPGQEPGCRCVPEINKDEITGMTQGERQLAFAQEIATSKQYPKIQKDFGVYYTPEELRTKGGFGPPLPPLIEGDLTKVMQDAAEKLQTRQFEGMYVIDQNGKLTEAWAGTTTMVSRPISDFARSSGKHLIHNHPFAWGLSGEDAQSLLIAKAETENAIATNGVLYTLRQTDKSRALAETMKRSEIENEVKAIRMRVYDETREEWYKLCEEVKRREPDFMLYMRGNEPLEEYGKPLPQEYIDFNQRYFSRIGRETAERFGLEYEERQLLSPVEVVPGGGEKWAAKQDWMGIAHQESVQAKREAEAPQVQDFETFAKAMKEGVPDRYRLWLTYYTPEEYEQMGSRAFLSKNGKSGYAISRDGEVMSVFSADNHGKDMVREAIENGGTKLQAFDGWLTEDYYPKFGFEEVGRIKWDDKYAPKGWDFERDGRPDVVEMALKGQKPEEFIDLARTGAYAEEGGWAAAQKVIETATPDDLPVEEALAEARDLGIKDPQTVVEAYRIERRMVDLAEKGEELSPEYRELAYEHNQRLRQADPSKVRSIDLIGPYDLNWWMEGKGIEANVTELYKLNQQAQRNLMTAVREVEEKLPAGKKISDYVDSFVPLSDQIRGNIRTVENPNPSLEDVKKAWKESPAGKAGASAIAVPVTRKSGTKARICLNDLDDYGWGIGQDGVMERCPGWITGNGTRYSLAIHEIGHGVGFAEGAAEDETIKALWADFEKLDEAEKASQLSRYAGKDIHEFVAEAIDEVVESRNPRTLSVMIWTTLFGRMP